MWATRPCDILGWLWPEDTLAERLRRRPAKPMGSPRVGSNPTGVDLFRDMRNMSNAFGCCDRVYTDIVEIGQGHRDDRKGALEVLAAPPPRRA